MLGIARGCLSLGNIPIIDTILIVDAAHLLEEKTKKRCVLQLPGMVLPKQAATVLRYVNIRGQTSKWVLRFPL